MLNESLFQNKLLSNIFLQHNFHVEFDEEGFFSNIASPVMLIKYLQIFSNEI